jgi:hypothetical protein
MITQEQEIEENPIAIYRERMAEETSERKPDARQGIVGFWLIGDGEPSSSARHYQDGMEISVVFQDFGRYNQIVISSHPHTNYDFAEREIAGIIFRGSIHSSGSPRITVFQTESGESRTEDARFTAEDAMRVFAEIAADPEKYVIIPPQRKRGSGDD